MFDIPIDQAIGASVKMCSRQIFVRKAKTTLFAFWKRQEAFFNKLLEEYVGLTGVFEGTKWHCAIEQTLASLQKGQVIDL